MTARKEKGRWPEFSDAAGIDAQYAAAQAEADRQLREATAGPQAVGAGNAATGDTDLKNPNGTFAMPSSYGGPHVRRADPGLDGQGNRRPGGGCDLEGQQGGHVRGGGPEQQVPVAGVRTPQGADP